MINASLVIKAISRIKDFTCWLQFLTMSFGQLTRRESLRDTFNCLSVHQEKFYHLGITSAVSRSTLAEANEKRNWRTYADFAQVLLVKARPLYLADDFGLDLANTVYALDSTTIDLCLSVFWWAFVSESESRCKTAHIIRLTQKPTDFYPYFGWHDARCQSVG